MHFSEIFGQAWDLYKRNKWKSIKITILPCIPLLSIFILFAIACSFSFEGDVLVSTTFVFIVLLFIFSTPLTYAQITTLLDMSRGEDVGLDIVLGRTLSYLFRSWGLILCILLKCLPYGLIALLTLLLYFYMGGSHLSLLVVASMVFGMYVFFKMIHYSVIFCVAHDNPEKSSYECVKMCKNYLRGYRFSYILTLIVLNILNATISIPLIGWILPFVFIPMMYIVTPIVYTLASGKRNVEEKIDGEDESENFNIKDEKDIKDLDDVKIV